MDTVNSLTTMNDLPCGMRYGSIDVTWTLTLITGE